MVRFFRNVIDQLSARERSQTRRRKTRPARRDAFRRALIRQLHLEPLEDRKMLAASVLGTEVSESTAQTSGVRSLSEVTLLTVNEASARVNQENLDALAKAAADRWIATGLTAEQTAALANITYQIADLGVGKLGVAEGSTITIDDDAAASGSWFIDITPDQDEEFENLSTGVLGALVDSGAAGRHDLLTVLIHEQGHILGMDDQAVTTDPADVMTGLISAGQRRLPTFGQAEGAVLGQLDGAHFIVPTLGSDSAATDTTNSLPFTVGAGNDRLLVVFAFTEEGGDITSMSYNGSPLTYLGKAGQNFPSLPIVSLEAFYVTLGDGAAITSTITTTDDGFFASGGDSQFSVIAAVAYEGVHQGVGIDGADPIEGFQFSEDAALSNTVTSEVGDLVVGAAYNRATATLGAGTGQTAIHTHFDPLGNGYGTFISSQEAGAASVVMDYSGPLTGSSENVSVAFNINALVAGAPEPAISIEHQPTTTPVADGDTTPSGNATTGEGTYFGSVETSGGLETRTFTIRNTGPGDLVLPANPVTITGADASHFARTQPGSLLLTTGQSTTFTVSFNPSADGLRNAVVHVANNDPDAAEADYDFAVQGIGTTAAPTNITQLGTAQSTSNDGAGPGTLTTTTLPFTVAAGTNRVLVVFGHEEESTGASVLTGVTFESTGGSPTTYPLTSMNLGGEAADALGRQQTEIYYLALGSGDAIIGNIVMSTSDVANDNDATILTAVAYENVDQTTPVDGFDSVNGQASDSMLNIVSEAGDRVVVVHANQSINGATADPVADAAQTVIHDLGPIQTHAYLVTSTETGAALVDSLHSWNSAPDSSQRFVTVGLNINAAPPEPEIYIEHDVTDVEIPDGDITPTDISDEGTDFGAIDTATGSEVRTFLVRNDGTSDLTLSGAPTLTGNTGGHFSISGLSGGGLVLAPTETRTFTVTFDPNADGNHTATVHVASDDANEMDYDFLVQGLGQTLAPALVTNLAQSTTPLAQVGNNPSGDNVRAANAFTTGPNAGGYDVESVTVRMGDGVGTPSSFQLDVFGDNAGVPGTLIQTLVGNTDPFTAGDYTYTATSLNLAASTTYHLVASASGTGADNRYHWGSTLSGDEVSTVGWTIDGRRASINGAAWGTSTFSALFSINGQEATSPPTFAKVIAPDTIAGGGISTLTFTINNSANVIAAGSLDFTDNLPAAVTVATPANASTTCTGGTLTATSGTAVISYTGGSVAAGASCTVQVDVTSSTVGTHVNTTGDLTSSLGNSGTASDSLIVEPPPTFAKLFAPDTIISGGASTITFTIDNAASALAASSLDVTDNLPAGVVIAAAPAASTTCTGGTLTAAAGTSVIFYTGGTVAAGATCTVQVDVTSSVAGSHVNTTLDLTSSSGNSGTASDTLNVIGLDFGDAPDMTGMPATGSPYPTLLEHNGARHALIGPFLGASVDDEADGQPDASATGDDTDGNDDEDGVTFTSPLIPGLTATVDVTTTGTGLLNAWIDFNDNGSWADPGEQIFTDMSLSSGANPGLTFSVPFVAPTVQTYARFRFDQGGGLSYDGRALDGEVEDYEVAISACSTTVTNINDSGAGSLRYAIQCANVTPGLDTIDFNISGGGVHTIAPMSNLPPIIGQATVDATTQMGYAGTPLIQLDGNPFLGPGGVGLQVNSNADGSIIRGFNLVGFLDKAVFISRADNVQVEANFIGTNPAGTAADPNGNNVGVLIINGAGNTIGGNTAAERNLIGGNSIGISIIGPNATNNAVSTNHIGVDINGTVGIGNTSTGVEIAAAPGNTIGGRFSSRGNVISNNKDGIEIRGSQATGNMIAVNVIGADPMVAIPLGNLANGVVIRNGADGNEVVSNIISANLSDGVLISNAKGNTIVANFLGEVGSGPATPLGNRGDGIEIRGTSQNNLIGGSSTAGPFPLEANVISGNSDYGVKLLADNNQVQGNRIGASSAGLDMVGNGLGGVLISNASNNTIGGANTALASPGNQIANHQTAAGAGVLINGNSSNNRIAGNAIGTTTPGTGARPNLNGVRINSSGTGNTIGGDATNGEGNLISGNTNSGVAIRSANGVNVYGNLIGTTAAGTAALPNGGDGIEIVDSTNIAVGGTGQGQGNVISGNVGAGVRIASGGVTVQANRIGTDQAGTATIANATGVLVVGAGNTIGGDATAGEGNQISGNTEAGVQIQGAAASGNMVRGNLIGTDLTGGSAVGNKNGVLIIDAPVNVMGGTSAADGNTISGNTLHGVFLQGPGATGNLVQGNQIGTNLAGTAALPNEANGVLIDGAPINAIGGTASGAGNIISGNDFDGVKVIGLGASNNAVSGNAIGTDAAGTTAIPNRNGVVIGSSASNNTVGDGTASAANTIADNDQRGVWINGNAGTGNTVRRNSIHDNGGASRLGIDLGGSGVTANDAGDPDAGANNLQNSPVIQSIVLNGINLEITYLVDSIAANSDYTGSGLKIEFFLADANNQEGETFVVDDGYTTPQTPAVVVIPGAGVFGQDVVATATDASGSTSEFSAPFTAPSPLLAAEGEASRESRVEGQELSIGELVPVFDAAVARLVAAGLDGSLFSTIEVSIADLPGATLALASGNSVTIDVNAAGHGWFVDTTSLDDSEFESGSGLSTLDSRPHIDLLTAVMHELGHAVGLDDLHDVDSEDDLMYGWLDAGQRRTSLDASLADEAFSEP